MMDKNLNQSEYKFFIVIVGASSFVGYEKNAEFTVILM